MKARGSSVQTCIFFRMSVLKSYDISEIFFLKFFPILRPLIGFGTLQKLILQTITGRIEPCFLISELTVRKVMKVITVVISEYVNLRINMLVGRSVQQIMSGVSSRWGGGGGGLTWARTLPVSHFFTKNPQKI